MKTHYPMSKNQWVKGSNCEIQLEDHESTAHHNFGGKLINIAKFIDVEATENEDDWKQISWGYNSKIRKSRKMRKIFKIAVPWPFGTKLNKLAQDLFLEFCERITAWVFSPCCEFTF